jgi:type VI secretion system protein ImpJ
MDDGTAFELPAAGEALAADFRTAFPAAAPSLNAFLALPEYRANGQNFRKAAESGAVTRYLQMDKMIVDETNGADEKVVALGRCDFQLLFGDHPPDGYVALPLARILKDGPGRFVLDERFIPPCVQINASSRLLSLSERLIGKLTQISASLVDSDSRRFHAGLSERQVASFWFSHALNSALAPLRHVCSSRHCHPERLYSELLRLGGALCTFGLRARPEELPLYNHDSLERCFEALERHILDHLELIEPSNCVAIPLTRRDENFYKGKITDQRCLAASRWVLGIRAALGEADLIEATPRLIKVCSNNFIEKLARRAVKGSLPLLHLPVPPAALSPKPTAQYYSLSKAGPCWEDIVNSKEIGIYVPSNFPAPELELLVILEA